MEGVRFYEREYDKKIVVCSDFHVHRSNSSQGPYYPVTNIGAVKYVDRGLSAATSYYYKVYAVSGPCRTAETGPVGQTTKELKKK